MLEERVGGVIGAEGSAHRRNGDALRLTVVPDKRHNLFAKVGIEDGLDIAAVERVRALVVKAEAVDGIDGEELNAAALNKIRKRADHTLAFEFPLIAGAGRKAQKRLAPVAENGHAQLQAEPLRVPTVIFTLHRVLPLTCCGEKRVCQPKDAGAIGLKRVGIPRINFERLN